MRRRGRGDINAARGRVVMVAAAEDLPSCLLSLNPDSGEVTRLRQSRELTVDAGYLSAPRPVAFETTDWADRARFLLPGVQPGLRRPAE